MKGAVWITLAAMVFVLVFPWCCARLAPREEEPVPETQAEEKKPEETSPIPEIEAPLSDSAETVRVKDGDSVAELSMGEYLFGVLAAEMPASFEREALKAQVVAARTYTRYTTLLCPDKHPDADVCTDPGCCKAFRHDSELRENWGDRYEEYCNKLAACILETDGEILVYEGEPILAVFHSSSAGYTEESGNVWESSLPYLQSVKSPETAEAVPDYVTTVRMSRQEFAEIWMREYPDAVLSDDPAEWFTDAVTDPSGRLSSLSVCHRNISGTMLRSLFSLRSAAITVSVENGEIVFTVTGYGHGVGMSQYGANVMAREGKLYEEILKWYYTGASLSAPA